jgi:hypothetical protein
MNLVELLALFSFILFPSFYIAMLFLLLLIFQIIPLFLFSSNHSSFYLIFILIYLREMDN